VRYLASRVAVAASLLFLILWIASAFVTTAALAVGNFGLSASLTRPAWALDLPLFGFLGLMVFGLAFQFMPLFAGRELVRPKGAIIPVILAIASIAISLGSSRWLAVGRAVWFGAAALFVGMILLSRKTGASPTPLPASSPEQRIVDRRAATLAAASIAYLLAASAGFMLVSPGGRPLVPAFGPYGGAVFHLYAFGFVALALLGLVFHRLPRFFDAVPRERLVTTVTVYAGLSPAAVAVTIPYAGTDGPARFLFLAFVLVEGAAAILFVWLVLSTARRSSPPRPVSAFLVVGSLWLVLAVGMGAYVTGFPGSVLRSTSAPDWITLFGFAGSVIFGVTHEVIPPYVDRSSFVAQFAVRVHQALATLGLVLVIGSQALLLAGYPRSSSAVGLAGLGLVLGMALSYVGGTLRGLAGNVPRPTVNRAP
jgi:hypothetical protein